MPVAPTTKKVSHPFGENRGIRNHNGIDYDVVLGTPVKASADGIVVRSDYHKPIGEIVTEKNGKKKKKFRGSYGNVIIIYHGQDLEKLKHTYTLYAHLDKILVPLGKKVKENGIIGSSGRSGTSRDFYNRKGGYNLHFEVIESLKELNWVRIGNLDDYFASEDRRIDPERFLRSFKALSLQVKNPNNYPLSPEVKRALSEFSNYIGKDKTIVVTDGDRPFDSDIGAKNTSQHVYKKAADIIVLGQSHLKTANQAKDSGLFDGIGWYEEGYYNAARGEGPHVHVDLRGTPARWGYDKNGKKHSGSFPRK